MESLKRIGGVLAILIFLVSLFSIQVSIPTYSAGGDIIFNPIVINGNVEFEEIARLMNWSGNGSADNPYVIENLTIQPPLGMNGIKISNTSVYFTIKNLKIIYASNPKEGVKVAGLYLYNVSNAIIEDSLFEGDKIGLYLLNSFHILMRNNGFVNDSEGIRVEKCENVKISDNSFYEGEIGIFILQSKDTNITGNHLEKNDISIGVRECEEIAIYNNDVYSHWDTGIGIAESTHIHIFGNNISVEKGRVQEDLSDNGISVFESNFTLIENNSIEGNYSQVYGMWLQKSVNITVEGNTIKENVFDGLEISGAKNILIEKNMISFNRHDGVKLTGSEDIILRDNKISYNYRVVYPSGYWGIGISLYDSSKNLIVENLIAFNGVGIRISKGYNSRIYNNTFFYNALSSDRYNKSHIQALTEKSYNYWNSSSGYGNYWADWARNNDTNDKNEDGIVDWPYKIGRGIDYYPLKEPPHKYKVEPTHPRNLKMNIGVGYINLTWSPSVGNGTSPIMGYKIYRNNKRIATVGVDTFYYNDTSVVNGVEYTYYITAFNFEKESIKSNEVRGIPGIPGKPLNLTGYGGDGYVNLSWKPPSYKGASNVKYYKIYRAYYIFPPPCPGGSPNWELIGEVQATQLYYEDTNVTNGESYMYSVSAVNEQGEGPRSNSVVVTPGKLPSPPRNLQVKMGDGYVNLTWDPPLSSGTGDVWEYRIYSNGKLIATVDLYHRKLLYYNYTPPESGTYVYYVTAINKIGESDPSNEVEIVYNAPSTEVPPQKDITLPLLIVGTFILVLILIIVALGKIWRKRRYH